MREDLIPTVVTSAAVGALASSLIGLVGAALERRARRRELLLEKAIQMAHTRREFVMGLVEKTGGEAALRDDVSLAAEYFQLLDHLIETGNLPESFKAKERESLTASAENDEAGSG